MSCHDATPRNFHSVRALKVEMYLGDIAQLLNRCRSDSRPTLKHFLWIAAAKSQLDAGAPPTQFKMCHVVKTASACDFKPLHMF